MENKRKHLELIQGVINRLAGNSFLLKGWSVVLTSALFALSVPNSRVEFVYFAYFPVLIFWGLDGYFLWQERLYRALYDNVRRLKEEDVDFSMDTSGFKGGKGLTWPEATLSRTLVPFHGVLILAIIVVMAVSLRTGG